MAYTIEELHGSYNRQRRTSKVSYILVHYVGAGTSAAGSANANCRYFAGGNRNASAHYFIDDASIWEYADPEQWATWHCGDGKGKYGITNQNSIGIEVCNNGGAFTDAEIDRLTWLVQKLMAQFGVDADHVKRHYDASRKMCPLYYVQNPSEWDKLHAQITGGSVSGNVSGGSSSGSSSSSSSSSSAERTGTGFGGTYTCTVSTLNVRTSPSTSSSVVAKYHKGDKVTLDDWYLISGGWVWGRYTGASSGLKRYVAVGRPTGGVASDDYLVKGGSSSGSAPAAKSWAGAHTTTDRLNVRKGPGTSYAISGTLPKGYTLHLDGTTKQADGYTWARYTASSGYYRWVATKWLS